MAAANHMRPLSHEQGGSEQDEEEEEGAGRDGRAKGKGKPKAKPKPAPKEKTKKVKTQEARLYLYNTSIVAQDINKANLLKDIAACWAQKFSFVSEPLRIRKAATRASTNGQALHEWDGNEAWGPGL